MSMMIEDEPRASWWRGRRGLAALIDFAEASHAGAIAFLIAVSLLAFLPGFFQIPPTDRDESRFAQATKQMIENGDYVDIRFQDETRYKKPVGIYWLQAGAVKLAEAAGVRRARTTIAVYRLPSLIGAIGAVLVTYWAALAFVPRRAAVLAGLMLAGSLLLGVEARLATTDAALLFTCVAAMGALGRLYLAGQGQRDAHPWLAPAIFWTALAGGILIKGPLILMFVGLAGAALVILDRSARWLWRLKPLPGVLWMLVLVLPWFFAIIARSGLDFFAEAIGHDLMAKVVSGQETHGAPPGYYVLAFWVTFFPAAMLLIPAAPAIWNLRREPGAKFLLAWTVPAWIVFEIAATKLPQYVLPLYPAIAILIAGVLDGDGLSQRPWMRRATLWWFVIAAVVAVALIIGPIFFIQRPVLLAWPFAAAAVVCGLCAWWLYGADGPERGLLRAICASILLSMAIFGALIPRLSGALFPATHVARALRAATCAPSVVTAGYDEPSLVFFAGTATRHADGAGAADFLYGGGCRMAVVEGREERAFVRRADEIGLRYIRGARFESMNVNNRGDRMSLAMFSTERPQ